MGVEEGKKNVMMHGSIFLVLTSTAVVTAQPAHVIDGVEYKMPSLYMCKQLRRKFKSGQKLSTIQEDQLADCVDVFDEYKKGEGKQAFTIQHCKTMMKKDWGELTKGQRLKWEECDEFLTKERQKRIEQLQKQKEFQEAQPTRNLDEVFLENLEGEKKSTGSVVERQKDAKLEIPDEFKVDSHAFNIQQVHQFAEG